jgi:hypothetical protein
LDCAGSGREAKLGFLLVPVGWQIVREQPGAIQPLGLRPINYGFDNSRAELADGEQLGQLLAAPPIGLGNLVDAILAPSSCPESQAHSTRGPNNQSPHTPNLISSFQSAPRPVPVDNA